MLVYNAFYFDDIYACVYVVCMYNEKSVHDKRKTCSSTAPTHFDGVSASERPATDANIKTSSFDELIHYFAYLLSHSFSLTRFRHSIWTSTCMFRFLIFIFVHFLFCFHVYLYLYMYSIRVSVCVCMLEILCVWQMCAQRLIHIAL